MNLADFDPTLPLERAHSLPSACYHDPALAAAERRCVFGATWLVAGRLEQLGGPGSYFTATLAGEPIVVLRDEAGTLRAFHNVCRHRAALVAPAGQGCLPRLRCRYHGWTYDLQGQLRGVPEFDGVEGFCREDHALTPLAVATWAHMVWVHVGTPQRALAEYLRPLPDLFAPLQLDRLRFVERREYELACNWKVFVDNYLDGGYHVNTIHPGLADALDYTQYRTTLADFTSVQSSPLRTSADASYQATRQGAMAYYAWVYPNFMLNCYSGVLDTNLVLPLGPERCRVVFDFFYPADADPAWTRQSIAVSEEVQREDVGICEDVQRGVHSGAYRAGRYSVKREAGVYHFHRLLAAALKEHAAQASAER